ARYQNLLHRYCDSVQIANRSNLANSFCSGIIQTDNHRLYKTPTYYMQWMYATLAGHRPLRIEPATAVGDMPDLSATMSRNGKAVVLVAVNAGLGGVKRQLDLSGFGKDAQRLDIWTLHDRRHAGELDAVNSFDQPERVAADHSELQVESGRFEYEFPALSVT